MSDNERDWYVLRAALYYITKGNDEEDDSWYSREWHVLGDRQISNGNPNRGAMSFCVTKGEVFNIVHIKNGNRGIAEVAVRGRWIEPHSEGKVIDEEYLAANARFDTPEREQVTYAEFEDLLRTIPLGERKPA